MHVLPHCVAVVCKANIVATSFIDTTITFLPEGLFRIMEFVLSHKKYHLNTGKNYINVLIESH